MWGAVVQRGDRAADDSDAAPLKGLRVEIFREELHARVAAASGLAAHYGENSEEVSQRQYTYARAARVQPHFVLRAIAAGACH